MFHDECLNLCWINKRLWLCFQNNILKTQECHRSSFSLTGLLLNKEFKLLLFGRTWVKSVSRWEWEGTETFFCQGTVSAWMCHLKGHCVVFGEEIHSQNFNVYNINKVIIQIYNRNVNFFHNFTNNLFSEWKQGPQKQTYNGLFLPFIQEWQRRLGSL